MGQKVGKWFLLLLLVLVCGLAGCGAQSDMPFNGDVTFHELSITIPDNFIRDSTQSDEDAWVFEQGWYSQLIIITRNDIKADAEAELNDYGIYMAQQGATARGGEFMGLPAVYSVYDKDDMFCQEILFAYNGSFYAIALRGGTTDEFAALLETLSLQ